MSAQVSLYEQFKRSRTFSEVVKAYFKAYSIGKLQLGSGTNILEGWINTDITFSSSDICFLDATVAFPLPNSSFHYIFSEHHIEHLSYQEGLFMLKECFRVLASGGRIRIATPSLETLLGLYSAQRNSRQKQYIEFVSKNFLPDFYPHNAVFVINNAFRSWGHQFLYDRKTLQSAVKNAGFVDVCFHTPGESEDLHLQGLEKHGDFIENEEMNRFETMVLEATRP